MFDLKKKRQPETAQKKKKKRKLLENYKLILQYKSWGKPQQTAVGGRARSSIKPPLQVDCINIIPQQAKLAKSKNVRFLFPALQSL